MELRDNKLGDTINQCQQIYAPPYQRNYSWKAEVQCKRLWEDLLDLINHRKARHFIGSVVVVVGDTKNGIPQINLIDGQQRITTFTLLLIALSIYAKEQDIYAAYAGALDRYLFNDRCPRENRNRLVLNGDDNVALEHLLDGGEINTKSKSLIYKNTQFFLERLREEKLTPDQILSILNCIQTVHVVLDTKDHPQRIFDSLNSTGQDLNPADMVRNYFLMSIAGDEQEFIYNQYWLPTEMLFNASTRAEDLNEFLTCFLRIYSTSEISPNKLFDQFKEMHNRMMHDCKTNKMIAAELLDKAKYFKDLVSINEPNYVTNYEYSDKVRNVLSEVPYLGTRIMHPIIITLLTNLDKGVYDEDTFIKAMRLLISFIIRRRVCNTLVRSSGLNDVLVILRRELDYTNVVPSLSSIFLKLAKYARFITDEEFETELTSKEFYKLEVAKYMLSMMECRRAPNFYATMTIEHIMPQNAKLGTEWQEALGPNWKTIQREMKHNIGNLTLTSYNSELGDKPFSEKVQQYQKSKMHNLNKFLVNQSTWNLELMQERARLLIKECLDIWPYPTK